ncbi:MAG: hypothetical protein NT154_20230, partial [Verrucomicrobia bacterium]|nr:hypothetical protein [Verrucomicrobiota bacterium]
AEVGMLDLGAGGEGGSGGVVECRLHGNWSPLRNAADMVADGFAGLTAAQHEKNTSAGTSAPEGDGEWRQRLAGALVGDLLVTLGGLEGAVRGVVEREDDAELVHPGLLAADERLNTVREKCFAVGGRQ